MRCAVCVLDSAADPKGFDAAGVCSFCRDFEPVDEKFKARRAAGELERIVAQIKREGAGKPHDCIIGLSGGVDSSYLAHLAVELGLRPLAIHLDNGWDSEVAIGNVDRLVNGLGLELETHVVDWREFRSLQVAYFRASVIDIEVLTDHAITAFASQVIRREGLRYILSGNNIATEWGMPPTWNYAKHDLRNLKAIAKRFGGPAIKTLPTASGLHLLGDWARGVRPVEMLDLIDYNRAEAIELLAEKFGYRPYGAKHYESLFTRFYQAYVLPEKFGVDKREAHYSSLIRSQQATREAMLAKLEEPLYDPDTLREHRSYVLKKLGFSDDEFDEIMATPPRAHTSYPNDRWYFTPISKGILAALNATYGLRQRFKRSAQPADQASESRSSAVK